MPHCDPDTLALIGLGEAPPTPQDAAHLRACEQCQAEVAAYADVVGIGRELRADDQLTAPPAQVWQRISAAISADPEGESAPDPTPDRADAEGAEADSVVVLDEQRSRRRGGRWLPILAAAAVGAVIGGSVIGGLAINRDSPSTPQVLASGELAPLPDGADQQTTGTARLERVGGQYVLQVSASQLPSPAGFYEVWMMNPETSGLVAMGTFNASQSQASFPVPESLPMTEYTSVDISDEPFDGVPGHSAVSVLRGNLTA